MPFLALVIDFALLAYIYQNLVHSRNRQMLKFFFVQQFLTLSNAFDATWFGLKTTNVQIEIAISP